MQSSSELLTSTEIMFYLSESFKTQLEFKKYIKWLHDKIIKNESIHKTLIHIYDENENNLFINFTEQLFKSKQMVSEYSNYEQGIKCNDTFNHKVLIANQDLTSDIIKDISHVYTLKEIYSREIYKEKELKKNVVDYEFHVSKQPKGELNKKFIIINRISKIHSDTIEQKIINTLNDEKVMNELYEIIKNIEVLIKYSSK